VPEIVLTPEQWAGVAAAERVEVKDPTGRVVGWLSPADAGVIADVRQRQSVPRRCFTGEQVRRQLAALEAERARCGGALPPERVAERVAGFDAVDPPAGSLRSPRGPR
jgi:hypothetical protein